MQVNVSNRNNKTAIVLQGRFDFNSHREFREAVDQAIKESAREIQVDLAGVDYLDSLSLIHI